MNWYDILLSQCTEQEDKVRALLEEGLTPNQIAKAIGKSASRVYEIQRNIEAKVYDAKRKEEIGLPL